MKQFLLKLCALPTLSNIFLDIAWRELTKRACHQTDFSDGEFVKKGPFSFFNYFLCLFLFFNFPLPSFFLYAILFLFSRGSLGICWSTWPYRWEWVSGLLLYTLLYKVYITHFLKHFFVSYCSLYVSKIDKTICFWDNVGTTTCNEWHG